MKVTVDKALIEQAIKAFERIDGWLKERRFAGLVPHEIEIADALRAALAEPAVEPVAHINSNGVVHAAGYPWEAGEVLTPLYASPPPPAKPAVEPFGYFRAEPFGWTDCAPTDEAAKALYEVPPPAEPAVDPIGYVTAPITWKSERFHSEQSMKITQHRQPVYGFMHPIYAAPPPAEVPLTDEAIAEAMANVWGCASIAPRQAPEFARAIERLIKGAGL